MKKFIKINLIILVIFCLSCNFSLFEDSALATENQNIEENNEQEGTNEEENKEKDLDTLQLEKSELESGLQNSNAQIEFIESINEDY